MNSKKTSVRIRIKDKVGAVSELCGLISSLGIAIIRHDAAVAADGSGGAISVFRAELESDRESMLLLRRRCERLRGFISYSEAA